jgi:hypothetical protein
MYTLFVKEQKSCRMDYDLALSSSPGTHALCPALSECKDNVERLPRAAKVRRLAGLVGQDILDLLHDLRGDLGNQLHGSAVVLDLRDLGSAEDDSADVRVHNAPSRES